MNAVGDMIGKLEQAATEMSAGTASPDVGPDNQDILATALSDIARHFGRAIPAVAITSGLPLTNGRLAIDHVAEAAERAGLLANRDHVRLLSLTDSDLPMIVVTRDGAAVLWRVETAEDGGASVAVWAKPGAPLPSDARPLSELMATATGEAVRVRPAPTVQTSHAAGDAIAGLPPKAQGPWFWFALKGLGGVYAKALAATVAVNILALTLPLFSMNVYDRVLPNAIEETLWALAIGAAIAVTFEVLIRTLRSRLIDLASRRVDVLLANFIFGRLLGARASLKPIAAGVRANALREFETLRDFLNSATLTVFGDLPFLVLFLVIIGVVAGSLVAVPLIAIPIVLAIAWLHQRALARLSEASFSQSAQKNAVIVETLVGLESVKAARAESWAASRWEVAVAEHVRTGFAMRNISNIGFGAVQGVQSLTQIAIIVAGFYLVAAGQMTMGALIAASMLTGRALQPLGQLAMLITRLHQVKLAYRALSDIVDAPQEREANERPVAKSRFDGRIRFENVSFRYEDDAPNVLKDVSFEIAPGERVGIVGTIGAGKTTILKLIQAHHCPQSGRVLLDGLQANHIDSTLLRAEVGFALKDATLFSGTIRSNIALADPGAGDESVLRAARAAGALEWIVRCPKGFDTPVRERGAGLSAGQRQSVALARALFQRPRILLLDEPTSDMDTMTEQTVVASLRQFIKGRTLVVVSHRPSLLALVDRLIVLEGGRVLLDGPKINVLKDLEALNVRRAHGAVARAAPQRAEGAS